MNLCHFPGGSWPDIKRDDEGGGTKEDTDREEKGEEKIKRSNLFYPPTTPVRIKFRNSLSLKIFFLIKSKPPLAFPIFEITSPWVPHRTPRLRRTDYIPGGGQELQFSTLSFQERTGTQNRHGRVTSTSR